MFHQLLNDTVEFSVIRAVEWHVIFYILIKDSCLVTSFGPLGLSCHCKFTTQILSKDRAVDDGWVRGSLAQTYREALQHQPWPYVSKEWRRDRDEKGMKLLSAHLRTFLLRYEMQPPRLLSSLLVAGQYFMLLGVYLASFNINMSAYLYCYFVNNHYCSFV